MMFHGERVWLRPLEREDLPARVRWINDAEVRKTLMFDYPTSLAKTERWFSNTIMDDTKRHFSIIHRQSGRLIGMTGLLNINQKHSKAQFYITIGEKEFWGQRLAGEIIPLVLEYAFAELGLNRVFLYTIPANERARKVYERCGFVQEGILRDEYFCVGRLQDLIVHAIIRKDWLAANGTAATVQYGV